ncbi:DUF6207 family protein [Streptomyces echinatus]|uniref:DUF6207 family protein n=1 Tax=Streptomyces echinatus TaxID=67293 RepID=UPI001C87E0F4|nr:DUF6207 family protein [Streptomyces echinatus]
MPRRHPGRKADQGHTSQRPALVVVAIAAADDDTAFVFQEALVKPRAHVRAATGRLRASRDGS